MVTGFFVAFLYMQLWVLIARLYLFYHNLTLKDIPENDQARKRSSLTFGVRPKGFFLRIMILVWVMVFQRSASQPAWLLQALYTFLFAHLAFLLHHRIL